MAAEYKIGRRDVSSRASAAPFGVAVSQSQKMASEYLRGERLGSSVV